MEPHRLYNNPPLHWGYSSSPHTIHNTWVPPPSRGVKRSISESDCDDNYSETSSKETSPKDNDADSCQHLSRKKRRGVIEKKRRDRINSSLSELKRLVPSAYEKQGSSKLEKAEILQLTVDHLKTLHAKGVDSMAFDPQRYAMDYHVIGFQECVSEVARYLITHEGMDIQNPLRMRLLSHLRCFAAQREISIKSGNLPPSQNWSPPTPHTTTYPLTQTHYGVASNTSLAPPPPSAPAPLLAPRSIPTTSQSTSTSLPTTSSAAPMYSGSYSATAHNYPYVPNLAPTASGDHYTESNVQTSAAGPIASGETAHAQLPHSHHNQQNYVQHHDQNGSIYTDLSAAQRSAVVSIGYSNQYPTNSISGFGLPSHEDDPLSAAYNSHNNSKPYRPWGGPEMAY